MGLVLFLIAVAMVFMALIVKVASHQGPMIIVNSPPKGIGQRTEIALEAKDEKHNVKAVSVEVLQAGQVVHRSVMVVSRHPHRWWKFWSGGPVSTLTWTVPVGREVAPELKEGRATIHITALNDSWGRFFRGGQGEAVLDLPVRFAPPQVEVLTTQHYINQGGCDMVLFNVSPGATESGVQSRQHLLSQFSREGFPSWNAPVPFRLRLQR